MKNRIRRSYLASIAALAVALLFLGFHWYDGTHGISWHRHGEYFHISSTGLPIAIFVSYSLFVFGVVRSRSLISRCSAWVSKSESHLQWVIKILPVLAAAVLVVAIGGFLVAFSLALTVVWPINYLSN